MDYKDCFYDDLLWEKIMYKATKNRKRGLLKNIFLFLIVWPTALLLYPFTFIGLAAWSHIYDVKVLSMSSSNGRASKRWREG